MAGAKWERARDEDREGGGAQIVSDFVGCGSRFPGHWRDFRQERAIMGFTFLNDNSGCHVEGR